MKRTQLLILAAMVTAGTVLLSDEAKKADPAKTALSYIESQVMAPYHKSNPTRFSRVRLEPASPEVHSVMAGQWANFSVKRGNQTVMMGVVDLKTGECQVLDNTTGKLIPPNKHPFLRSVQIAPDNS